MLILQEIYRKRIIMTDLLINLSISEWLNAEFLFTWFMENADYLMVFLCMAIESSFIPFPSEIVIPPAVYIGIHTGNMNVVLIVLVATAGALVGALVNYYLAQWLGRPIIYRFADSKVGQLFLLNRQKVKKAEDYFDKHGATATFFGRLIPAVRQLISIPAGLAKMNIGKFIIFTALGAGIWNIILAVIGYALSSIPKDSLFEMIEKYNGYLTYGGLALLGAIVLYVVIKALRHKSSTTPPPSKN